MYTAVNKVVFVACENNINKRGRVFSEMSWFCIRLIESKFFTKFGYFTGCIVTEHIKIEVTCDNDIVNLRIKCK